MNSLLIHRTIGQAAIYKDSDIHVYWSDACHNYTFDDNAIIRGAVEAAQRTTGANGSLLRHLWENDPEKFGRTLCAGLQAAGRVPNPDLEPHAVFVDTLRLYLRREKDPF